MRCEKKTQTFFFHINSVFGFFQMFILLLEDDSKINFFDLAVASTNVLMIPACLLSSEENLCVGTALNLKLYSPYLLIRLQRTLLQRQAMQKYQCQKTCYMTELTVGFFAEGISSEGIIAKRKFCRTDFFPKVFFAVENFVKQNFPRNLPDFFRTEFLSYGFLPVRKFSRTNT